MMNHIDSKLRLLPLALSLAFLLTACQPTPPATPTTSTQSPTAAPTHTPLPLTPTPTPTDTPLPTPTATATPTNTPLPTPTPTHTPLPTDTPVPTPAVDDAPMVRVPAGEFIMGTSYEDVIKLQQGIDERYAGLKGWYRSDDLFAVEMPRHTVYLNEFRIDQYEVTNARYRRCVEAGVCNPPSDNDSRTREHYYDDPAYDDYPVVHVGWIDADTYCRWVGKRLPTEAEWEKAARGSDGRLWPWGNEWDVSKVNAEWSVGDTTPVGSYPEGASPYGVLDMAGNVWEWVEDWAQLYPGTLFHTEDTPAAKVMRGGSYDSDDRAYVRTAFRAVDEPTAGGTDFNGFRCAIGGPHPTPEPTATPTPTGTPDMSRWEEMILIPAGEFLMGSKEDDPSVGLGETPQHQVYLDAFHIDKYEVTYAQYVEFLNDIGHHRWGCYGHDCTRIRGEYMGQFTHILYEEEQYVVEEGYENYPVGFVSWYGARAYCEYYGLRLPTEAEWEKAARGTDGRIWPWGNEWDPNKVTTSGDLLHGVRDIAPVGSKPEGASPYGALDMAGNVSEWVADWWARDYYSHSPYRNPTGPDTGEDKVLRGGHIAREDGSGVRTVRRSFMLPDSNLDEDEGFRCAYSSQE